MPQRLRLLVPALNEAENLPRLLHELAPMLEQLARPWKLLVVDDGSSDDTIAVARGLARSYPIHICRHDNNLGPGAAFYTGFTAHLEDADDDDPIITLEADTTSDVELLPRMLERFDAGADLVLASPYHPDGGFRHTAFHRKLMSAVANAMLQQAFDLKGIHTFSSFYRVYRASLLREAISVHGDQLMEEPGFAAVVELLIKLQRLGARIEELPMVLDSAKRKGSSRMRIPQTVKAYLKLMWNLRK